MFSCASHAFSFIVGGATMVYSQWFRFGGVEDQPGRDVELLTGVSVGALQHQGRGAVLRREHREAPTNAATSSSTSCAARTMAPGGGCPNQPSGRAGVLPGAVGGVPVCSACQMR